MLFNNFEHFLSIHPMKILYAIFFFMASMLVRLNIKNHKLIEISTLLLRNRLKNFIITYLYHLLRCCIKFWIFTAQDNYKA